MEACGSLMLAPVWVPFSAPNLRYFRVVLLTIQTYIWFSPVESFHVLKMFIFSLCNSAVGHVMMAHVGLFSNSSLSALLKRTLTKLTRSPAERVSGWGFRSSGMLCSVCFGSFFPPNFRTACGPRLKGSCSPRRAKAATTPRRDGFVLLPNFCLCLVSGALFLA
jgi:hypothetical protein